MRDVHWILPRPGRTRLTRSLVGPEYDNIYYIFVADPSRTSYRSVPAVRPSGTTRRVNVFELLISVDVLPRSDHGPSGSRKTFLANALGHASVRRQHSVINSINADNTYTDEGLDGGATGGASGVFNEPAYQLGVVPASMAHSGGSGHAPSRVVPDISALGDWNTGIGMAYTEPGANGGPDQYRTLSLIEPKRRRKLPR
jgi:hypothetical protein